MEGTNNILKNRYYLVTKDDKPYAYFSVKKDFYTEGYLVNEKTVLVGYFNGYKSFDVHTIDNLNNSPENHLNGLSIVPKKVLIYFRLMEKFFHQIIVYIGLIWMNIVIICLEKKLIAKYKLKGLMI